MQKLRKEISEYYKQLMIAKSERVAVKHVIQEPSLEKRKMIQEILENKKMKIDQVKLQTTIQKALIPIKKKEIIVIDLIPKVEKVVEKKKDEPRICQAKNLNGTPCKCRAKIGKFCAKHAP